MPPKKGGDVGRAEVQDRMAAEAERGYRGEVTDPEPNSTYRFPNPGVATDKPAAKPPDKPPDKP